MPLYYDFASTICYVAHRVLGRLAARIDDLGVDLEWRPIDLTRVTGWRRGARVSGPGREKAMRVASDLEVPVQMPPLWIDSRVANTIALAGGLEAVKSVVWRERVWTAIYEEGRDIGGEGEIERLCREIGIEPPVVDVQELADATDEARRAGVQGVPTFLIDSWPMAGIQEDQAMTAFFERYVRKRRRERGETTL